MTATRQLAIIMAFVALWEIKFEQMATVWEKGSRLQILGILPTPGEAKAKAMPGRLYTHTKINNNK